ncbi:MAG: phosphoesterase [Rhodobacteraceae bacterium]|nr:phosphoesterase [Paracoccaceae bacterium]
MRDSAISGTTAPTYIINRSRASDNYTVWTVDPGDPALVTQVPIDPSASFPAGSDICAIGGYLLAYSLESLQNPTPVVDYNLFSFDPSAPDPLSGPPVQMGQWDKMKFFGFYNHYTWDTTDTDIVQLIPMTGYVMAYMPTAARGTFRLWNFDPGLTANEPVDPLCNPGLTQQDSFSMIGEGSELLPIGNYVLEWMALDAAFRVWSFDPQVARPLQLPFISEGTLPGADASHRLQILGDYVLDWVPETRSYRVWAFDARNTESPFGGPVQEGILPEGFDASSILTTVQTPVPVNPIFADVPGTMDFMRDKIEHVVVYMLESRSMDSVLGWLYANNPPPLNYVNAAAPFLGNSFDYYNMAGGEKYNVYQYKDGILSDQFTLASPQIDPFHGTPDSIRQLYSGGYSAYLAGEQPDMGGFVTNNCSPEVMATFSPVQLPVLNGLAGAFAVSDYWFSALPGGTDSNRAFALSGSSYNISTTYEGPPQYQTFSDTPHRQSIWKLLWNNGITDWKIYYAVEWMDHVFTYNLYLKGEIPTVDADLDTYVSPIDQFFDAAQAGTLPRFSFLEPAWISPDGATSYHPGATGDMVPAEVQLNKVYEALLNSPNWDRTALVITFSKGGGMFDHVVPPGTVNPWPNDVNDGFTYDVLGPRVPAIVVSPLVNPNTVFRSGGDIPFSATSLASTILDWFGIPQSRWGLGDRIQQSPTFESVFQRADARTDKPAFTPPYDDKYGTDGKSRTTKS